MKKLLYFFAKLKSEKGVTAIIVALLLVVLLGVAALAIDVGYLALAKNQCQNAVDAAALAGARKLGENYDTNVSPPDTNVDSVAQATAQANKAAGKDVEVALENIEVGVWGTEAGKPTPHFYVPVNNFFPNAVRVTTNTTFDSFFARIFGKSTLDTGATAIAALFGPCIDTPTIPLGISTGWFDLNPGTGMCGKEIILGDTKDSCAGWTNLENTKFKQQDVQDMLEDKTPMPEVHSGDIIEFGGGVIGPVLEDLLTLFDTQKGLDDDGDPSTWTTSVVVYEGGCENPVTPYTAKGFSTIKITAVRAPSNTSGGLKLGLTAQIVCKMSEDNRGGCINAGTVGKYPRLVGKTAWPGF